MFHFSVLEIPEGLSKGKRGRRRAAEADFAFLLFLNIIRKSLQAESWEYSKLPRPLHNIFKAQREKQNKKEWWKPILKFPLWVTFAMKSDFLHIIMYFHSV